MLGKTVWALGFSLNAIYFPVVSWEAGGAGGCVSFSCQNKWNKMQGTGNDLGAPAQTLEPLICAEIEFFMKACQSLWSEASPRHTITSQWDGFVLGSQSCSWIHQEGWQPRWTLRGGWAEGTHLQVRCCHPLPHWVITTLLTLTLWPDHLCSGFCWTNLLESDCRFFLGEVL